MSESARLRWQDCTDEKEKYNLYLASREWAEKKHPVHVRSQGICERCHINKADHVHHLTYIRKYNERPEDLAHWCQGCHDFVHGKRDDDPINTSIHPPKTIYAREEIIDAVFGGDPTIAPIKILPDTNAYWQSGPVLQCPICSSPSVCIHQPSQNYQFPEDCNNPQSESVFISMMGECGHFWEIVFVSEKGKTHFGIHIPKQCWGKLVKTYD